MWKFRVISQVCWLAVSRIVSSMNHDPFANMIFIVYQEEAQEKFRIRVPVFEMKRNLNKLNVFENRIFDRREKQEQRANNKPDFSLKWMDTLVSRFVSMEPLFKLLFWISPTQWKVIKRYLNDQAFSNYLELIIIM